MDTKFQKKKILHFYTAATRIVAAGIDLVIVKELLGHEDLTTTLRYSHPVPERKLKAIEALNNF